MMKVFKYSNVVVHVLGNFIILKCPKTDEILFTYDINTNDMKFTGCEDELKGIIQNLVDMFFKLNIALGRI